MVTIAATYPQTGTIQAAYPIPEPSVFGDVRAAVNDVMRQFINESVHAHAAGVKALEDGDFTTLEELTKQIEAG